MIYTLLVILIKQINNNSSSNVSRVNVSSINISGGYETTLQGCFYFDYGSKLTFTFFQEKHINPYFICFKYPTFLKITSKRPEMVAIMDLTNIVIDNLNYTKKCSLKLVGKGTEIGDSHCTLDESNKTIISDLIIPVFQYTHFSYQVSHSKTSCNDGKNCSKGDGYIKCQCSENFSLVIEPETFTDYTQQYNFDYVDVNFSSFYRNNDDFLFYLKTPRRSKAGIIVGCVIGSIGLLVVVGVIVFFFVKKKETTGYKKIL